MLLTRGKLTHFNPMNIESKPLGKLIVFEGIDGTGKSTQIKLLKSYLEARGVEVVQSYEPTHNKWGKILRNSAIDGRLPIEDEVELFLKDRKQHVDELIIPSIKNGKWVLLDRYYLSMMAYQGARGLDVQEIRRANEAFAPQPDLVFWLDIPVEEAHRRIGDRGRLDFFETEEMLTACRNIFASISDSWMQRIDAGGTPEQVHQKVCAIIRGM